MLRQLAMCLLPLVVLGCGPSAQEKVAREYVTEMTPLLEDNTKLSRSFLELAALIKKKRASPQDVSDKLAGELIPAARALHEGAEGIRPPTAPLDGIHMGLVRAWGNRLRAYEMMHTHWVEGDLTGFEGTAGDHKTVFKAEARYFTSVNEVLAEHQLNLVQYP